MFRITVHSARNVLKITSLTLVFVLTTLRSTRVHLMSNQLCNDACKPVSQSAGGFGSTVDLNM